MPTKHHTKNIDSDEGRRKFTLIYVDELKDSLSFLPKRKFLLILTTPRRFLTMETTLKMIKAGADYVIGLKKNAVKIEDMFDWSPIIHLNTNPEKEFPEEGPTTITLEDEPVEEIAFFALNTTNRRPDKVYKDIVVIICKDKKYYNEWKTHLEL